MQEEAKGDGGQFVLPPIEFNGRKGVERDTEGFHQEEEARLTQPKNTTQDDSVRVSTSPIVAEFLASHSRRREFRRRREIKNMIDAHRRFLQSNLRRSWDGEK